ncbi:MAG: hypothetical protein R3E01_35920 [Pirellulaceae bacterium]|nr:hypothetical protein [Planctomycetales bacterium]
MNCFQGNTRLVVLLVVAAAIAGCDANVSPRPVQADDESRLAVGESPANWDNSTGTSPDPAVGGVTAGNSTTAGSSATVDAGATKPRPRMTIRAGGVRDLTFDDLEFDIQPDQDFQVDLLTEQIQDLDGRQVILRGFMLDTSVFTLKGIKQFVLIRDNQICCFGPGAKLFHNCWIDMEEGAAAAFSSRPVTVEGVFNIRPWHAPDGKCYSVFHITASKVK